MGSASCYATLVTAALTAAVAPCITSCWPAVIHCRVSAVLFSTDWLCSLCSFVLSRLVSDTRNVAMLSSAIM